MSSAVSSWPSGPAWTKVHAHCCAMMRTRSSAGEISSLHAGPRAELDDEREQDDLGGQEEGADDERDQQEKVVDVGRVRRRLRDVPGNHERVLMTPAGTPQERR